MSDDSVSLADSAVRFTTLWSSCQTLVFMVLQFMRINTIRTSIADQVYSLSITDNLLVSSLTFTHDRFRSFIISCDNLSANRILNSNVRNVHDLNGFIAVCKQTGLCRTIQWNRFGIFELSILVDILTISTANIPTTTCSSRQYPVVRWASGH